MNQTQEKIIEARTVVHEFTEDELVELGQEMTGLMTELYNVELEKKYSNKQLNVQIKAIKKEVQSAVRKFSNGSEERTVDCEVLFNTPVYGKKTLIRPDTFQNWEEDMSDEEFNLFNQADYPIHHDGTHCDEDEEMMSWEEE